MSQYERTPFSAHVICMQSPFLNEMCHAIDTMKNESSEMFRMHYSRLQKRFDSVVVVQVGQVPLSSGVDDSDSVIPQALLEGLKHALLPYHERHLVHKINLESNGNAREKMRRSDGAFVSSL